jgi:hypothetical protein
MPVCVGDECCLSSSVKNISGSEKHFSYLGNRGITLAANEVVRLPGDVRQSVLARGVRDYTAFNGDLFTRAVIDILHTPNPILYDKVRAEPQMLRVNNSVISAVDPCWNNTTHSF